MRLALMTIAALTVASCSAATDNRHSGAAARAAAATEIDALREKGICLVDREVTEFYVNKGVMDWWTIRFPSRNLLKDVTASVSWNPPVPPEMDSTLRNFRKNRKGNGIFRLGDDELIAVPKDYHVPYIHFFGGTPQGRQAAAKLVTFCKP
jgi:hypothetical protein